MFEMMAGRSPFDIVGMADANPDQNTEEYLFQVSYLECWFRSFYLEPNLYAVI